MQIRAKGGIVWAQRICKDVMDKVLSLFPDSQRHIEEFVAQSLRDIPLPSLQSNIVQHLFSLEEDAYKLAYLLELNQSGRTVFFTGDTICREGDDAAHQATPLYVLLRGIAALFVQGVEVKRVQSPCLLGEVNAFGLARRRTHTIYALAICELAVIPRVQVLSALEECPKSKHALIMKCKFAHSQLVNHSSSISQSQNTDREGGEGGGKTSGMHPDLEFSPRERDKDPVGKSVGGGEGVIPRRSIVGAKYSSF